MHGQPFVRNDVDRPMQLVLDPVADELQPERTILLNRRRTHSNSVVGYR